MRNYIPEALLVLTACQPTDRVAGQVPLQHLLQALLPHTPGRYIEPALNDAEQVLLMRPPMRCDAAVQPTHRSRSGHAKALFVFIDAAHYIVKLHDDIRT